MSLNELEEKLQLEKIVEHHYSPRWMTGHPHRIRFYYRLLQLVYLRSRICHRHLREILAGLDPGSVILDAGCGEGQFLIPAAQQYPGLSFVGMDLRTTHISFLLKLYNDSYILLTLLIVAFNDI